MNKPILLENLPSVKPENLRHLIRYVNFINSRPLRALNQKGFCTHHVYPKSLAKKNNIIGYNEEWNLIELTPREHYIAHMILWKCGYLEMVYAYKYMIAISRKTSEKREVCSKEYERILKTLHHSQETKIKMSLASKGIPKSKEHCNKLKESKLIKPTKYWKDKKLTDDHKIKLSISHGGDGTLKKKKTDEEIQISKANTLRLLKEMYARNSIRRKGKTYEEIFGDKSSSIKEKLSKNRKGKTYEEILGDKADATKEKIRISLKLRWKNNHFNCKVLYLDGSSIDIINTTITELTITLKLTRKAITKMLNGQTSDNMRHKNLTNVYSITKFL